MKVVLNDKRSENVGSTRIWIHNLAKWLEEAGAEISVNDWDNYQNYDVAIFGKTVPITSLREARLNNPNILCGSINPSDLTQEKRDLLTYANFQIVGSIEEKDYYLQYTQNVFIIPLIETFISKRKTHQEKAQLKVAYHGNLEHLSQLMPYINPALERIASEFNITLSAIYNLNDGKWQVGRPKITIEDHQWDINTFENLLLESDIGIVPGIVPILNEEKGLIIQSLDQARSMPGCYPNDYLLRFKNNSNAGRPFVFHQIGLPVVSDFIPSSFHILGNPRNGYLAHSSSAWYYSLKKLCESAEHRQEVADYAYDEFQRQYNPIQWSKDLLNGIKLLSER